MIARHNNSLDVCRSCRLLQASLAAVGNLSKPRDIRGFATKRRRGKPRSLPVTSRDRMRQLVETNRVDDASSIPLIRKADRLLDLANSRISFVRNKIYSSWNQDYLKETSAKQRPHRRGPEMDARWWFWNIAFALLPAFLIGTYCEFRGQYLMKDYHRRLELHQLKEKMGDAFDESAVPPELLQAPETSPFLERMSRVKNELISGVLSTLGGSFSGTNTTDQQQERDQPEDTSVVETPTASTKPEAAASIAPSTTGTVMMEPDPSMQIFLQRLEKLEAIVLTNDTYSPTTKEQLHRHMEEIRHSTVKSRAEADIQRRTLQKKQPTATENTPSGGSTPVVAWTTAVRERVAAVVEAAYTQITANSGSDAGKAPEADPAGTTVMPDGKPAPATVSPRAAKVDTEPAKAVHADVSPSLECRVGALEPNGHDDDDAPNSSRPWWKVW